MTYQCVRRSLHGVAAVLAAFLSTSGAAPARAATKPEHLFTRMTADGVRVTAFVGDVRVQLISCADRRCPKRMPGIQLRFDVDGRHQVFGLPNDEIPPAYGVRVVNAGGYLEPRVSWSVVQVARSVAMIRVRTGPDAVDEMTPAGGYAVFATTGTFGRLEAVDAAGTVIVTCSVPVAGARCSLA